MSASDTEEFEHGLARALVGEALVALDDASITARLLVAARAPRGPALAGARGPSRAAAPAPQHAEVGAARSTRCQLAASFVPPAQRRRASRDRSSSASASPSARHRAAGDARSFGMPRILASARQRPPPHSFARPCHSAPPSRADPPPGHQAHYKRRTRLRRAPTTPPRLPSLTRHRGISPPNWLRPAGDWSTVPWRVARAGLRLDRALDAGSSWAGPAPRAQKSRSRASPATLFHLALEIGVADVDDRRGR